MNADQSRVAVSRCVRVASLSGSLVGVILAVTAMTAGAQVEIGKANDYYQARGSGQLRTVEQYHLGKGEAHLRKREYAQAYSEFLFILKIFPNHPRTLALMVQVCEQWKSPHCRSEEFLERAVSINPNASGTFVVQGIYLHRMRQYPKAIESYKQALEIDPNSVNAQYNLGLAYLETKQYESANEHAQRAYALGAPMPGLRQGLERVGQWKPAQQGAATSPQPETSGSKAAEDRSGEASKK
jgi:tetratricopeptide (TPR) repeat protein